ncbi:hypothetical protein ACKLNO_05775 [Neisseriaceae bacterium B1]
MTVHLKFSGFCKSFRLPEIDGKIKRLPEKIRQPENLIKPINVDDHGI